MLSLDEMHFCFRSGEHPTKLRVSDILCDVSPEVRAEMKKYRNDGDLSATDYADLAQHRKKMDNPPNRPNPRSSPSPQHCQEQSVTPFRSRLKRLCGKAYDHIPAKDPEPMKVSL